MCRSLFMRRGDLCRLRGCPANGQVEIADAHCGAYAREQLVRSC